MDSGNKLNGKKTYEYVFEYFLEQILSGKLRLNDRIPTERDIAQQLGVSRNSVREVMHMMEIGGIIECRQGSGNYVRCNTEDYMFNTANMIMRLLDINYQEVFELRVSYENTAFKLAMKEASAKELRDLLDLLNDMEQPMSVKESAKMDIQFHHKLVEASHNKLLILNYSMMDRLLNSLIESMRSKILMDKNRAEQLRQSHWDIYNSLVKHDLQAGFAALDRHFRIVSEQMEKVMNH